MNIRLETRAGTNPRDATILDRFELPRLVTTIGDGLIYLLFDAAAVPPVYREETVAVATLT